MKSMTRGRLVAGVLALAACTGQAQWLQSGVGPYDYNDTANWSGGVINGVFPSSLTFPNYLPSYVDAHNVTFAENTVLSTGLSFTHTLTDRQNVLLKGSGADRSITLGGDLSVNPVNGGTQLGLVVFGSSVSGSKLNIGLGGDRTFNSTLARANGRGVVFLNDVSGAYDLTKTGLGSVIFENSTSFSGDLAVQAGEVNLSLNGALAGVSGVILGGPYLTSTLVPTLSLDNRQGGQISGGNINVADRVSDAATVSGIGNSRLHFRGHNSTLSSETIGTYASLSGLNRITAVTSDGSPNTIQPETTLTLTSLNRSAGSVLLLGGGAHNNQNTTYNDLGQGSGAGNARILATQINSAAPASARVNGIVPWAVMADMGNFVLSAFATYGANGFKPYGLDEAGALNDNGGTEPYVATLAAAGATDNVRLTAAETISGTKTVNSLNTTVAVNRTAEGDTLALTSGALLAKAVLTIQPRIDLGGREGVIVATHQLTLPRGLHNDGGNGVVLANGQQTSGNDIFIDGDSTYTGPTRIAYGYVAPRAAFGIPTNSAVRVDVGGFVNLWDASEKIFGSLAGQGRVGGRNHNDVAMILTVGGNNESTTFEGQILNAARLGGGTLGLTKRGSGTLTLSGANTYLGTTAVNGGALIVDGSIASRNVATSDSATLGGVGTIAGLVTITSGGTLTAGQPSSIGTLTLSSNLLMNAGAKLLVNLSSQGHDRVVVCGSTVNLNADSGAGATLEVNLAGGYEPKAGTQFTILEKQTAGTLLGMFAQGGLVASGGVSFAVDYVGGDGDNDIVLTVLPKGTTVIVR